MFRSLLPANAIDKLTGETGSDLKILGSARVIVATVNQWDMLSRRWRQRKAVQRVSLFIFWRASHFILNLR